MLFVPEQRPSKSIPATMFIVGPKTNLLRLANDTFPPRFNAHFAFF